MSNITDPGSRCYDPTLIVEIDGIWDSTTNDAIESQSGWSYRCNIIFEYSGVDISADVYKVHIDYDGVFPGLPWEAESLEVLYQWGETSTWTHLAYLDIYTSDEYWVISDATSSTFRLRIVDCGSSGDQVQHTWYFGDTPELWLY